jgi:sugar lactone lactonase YvrE
MLSTRVRIAVSVALAAAVVTAHASSPQFFQAATQADFLRGDVENLSIDETGQLILGPATDLVYETSAPYLWTLTPSADGSLFVGTGNEGQVLRIDARGQASRFFDAAELEVHALAPAPNGALYAASSPDGKIYRIEADGTATTFFDPEDRYIWALAIDATGALYAATGQKGSVYRISPDGEGRLFYESKATHVTSLALDKAGNLFIGTESPGRVLRVGGDGKAFLLLDSPFQEIRALRFDEQGALYVAAINGSTSDGSPTSVSPESAADRSSSTDGSRAPIPVVTTEVTSMAIIDTTGGSTTSASPAPERGMAKGAIYRIAPDGLWDQVWESRDDSPYDIVIDGQGRLVVGTGSKGKIFRLDGNPPQATLLARAAAEQVTALYKAPGGELYYTTANPGKLFRLSSGLAPRGSYESEPRDAKIVSTWGAISWRGDTRDGRIEVSTRSGNTATPDETWSVWSESYRQPEGSPITSPKARYLQWRVALSGRDQSPVLTSVRAAYLQRNVRPEVQSVTVHPPGIVYQKPFSTGDPDLAGFENQTTPDRKLTNAAMSPQQGGGSSLALGRRTYEKGLQTLAWRAADENDDELLYRVEYRREGEPAWKLLREDLADPILVWDTTTVPNGAYLVKVTASDAPANASDLSLAGELVSSAFVIDNTPPAIVVQDVRVEGGRTRVSFEVNDDQSPLQRVECSEDGQAWRPVFPRDGIADSKEERYEVTLERPLGPRGLSIRATDAMNNVAAAQVDAPKP